MAGPSGSVGAVCAGVGGRGSGAARQVGRTVTRRQAQAGARKDNAVQVE